MESNMEKIISNNFNDNQAYHHRPNSIIKEVEERDLNIK